MQSYGKTYVAIITESARIEIIVTFYIKLKFLSAFASNCTNVGYSEIKLESTL